MGWSFYSLQKIFFLHCYWYEWWWFQIYSVVTGFGVSLTKHLSYFYLFIYFEMSWLMIVLVSWGRPPHEVISQWDSAGSHAVPGLVAEVHYLNVLNTATVKRHICNYQTNGTARWLCDNCSVHPVFSVNTTSRLLTVNNLTCEIAFIGWKILVACMFKSVFLSCLLRGDWVKKEYIVILWRVKKTLSCKSADPLNAHVPNDFTLLLLQNFTVT